MRAFGMDDLERSGCAEQRVYRAGGGGDLVHALPMEIGVPQRSANQHAARRQGADHLMKIKRNLRQATCILGQTRHVARLAPAFAELPDRRGAIIVIEIRIEAAAAHDDLKPIVEHRGSDGVMTAERMADNAIGTATHVRQGVQKIKGTHIIPHTAFMVPLA